MNRSPGVQKLLDGQTRRLFSMTAGEAQTLGICVRCKESVDTWRMSEVSEREYNLSALCADCWDELFAGDES